MKHVLTEENVVRGGMADEVDERKFQKFAEFAARCEEVSESETREAASDGVDCDQLLHNVQ